MTRGLILNQQRREIDPSRTLALRRAFEGEMYSRFRHLKGLIRDAIEDKKALGDYADIPVTQQEANPGQFDFPTLAEKTAAFMAWLREQQEQGILEVRIRRQTGFLRGGTEPWTNVYIRSAYERGLGRAWQELKKEDAPIPASMAGAAGVAAAVSQSFHRPFHADRVALLYTRAFSELRGVTEAMDQQISRVLAEGMAEGVSARTLANRLNDRVDKIGIVRARMIARTEIIRAHHTANMGVYKQAGMEGVEVVAEYSTAQDNRVCTICAPLNGKIFDLEEAESLIPQHPNCRCAVVPRIKIDGELQ